MEIKNKQTGVKYQMPKTSWEQLGKNQRLFVVINDTDEDQVPPQIIDNLAKPVTGEVKDKKNTQKQTSKK